jgi:hypothetical protein
MTEQLTRRQYSRLIQSMADEGMSASEIARKLSTPERTRSRQWVMKVAGQYSVRIQPRGGSRRVGAQFSGHRYQAIKQLADAAGISVGAMLVRLAAITIDEGLPVAQRKLGRLARPKRRYTRKTP